MIFFGLLKILSPQAGNAKLAKITSEKGLKAHETKTTYVIIENVCFISEAFSACVAKRHSLDYWPTHHRWVGNIVITMSDVV